MKSYSTIDHALGSFRSRYFGRGHRQSVYGFTATSANSERVEGTGSIAHDGLWSEKSAGTVSRHLTTIDGVSLAGLALEHAFRLHPVVLEQLLVTSVTIRAGRAATADVSSVPIITTVAWNPQAHLFDCDISVGTLKITLAVRHVPGSLTTNHDDPSRSFFASHLRDRIQHIDDIDIDCEVGALRARIGSLSLAGPELKPYSGLQAAHDDLFSVSEAIVCLAQLAQTLAYEMDHISRDESNIFWLRRLTVSLSPPYIRVGQICDVAFDVVKSSELPLANQQWRALRLSVSAGTMTAVGDVAHALPMAVGV